MAAISPILSEIWSKQSSFAEPLGFIIAALIVAGAVALFLLNGFKLKAFEWMEKEPFETAYGVDGMAKERLQSFMPKFAAHIIIGVVLCIVALATFAASELLPQVIRIEKNAVVAVGLAIIAIAVYLFVSAGIIRGAFSRVLQEDDYLLAKALVKRSGDHDYLLACRDRRLSAQLHREYRSWLFGGGGLCGVLISSGVDLEKIVSR